MVSSVAGGQRPPFSMRLFMPHGDPDGVKVVEKSNWSGVGILIPRSLYPVTKSRPELSRAGVYVLVGPDESTQLLKVYVGEGDPIGPRLDQHAKNKDFWTHAVAFTSKDLNLNKAHVQFLEAELLTLAKAAKRCRLDNLNTPQGPSLSEADKADVATFLSDVLLCLAVLGYTFFEIAMAPQPSARELYLSAKGLTAKGYESAAGFVVRAGSLAAITEAKSIHAYLSQLRKVLVGQGVLAEDGAEYRMTQDYAFASPSTAAGVMLGRTANGRIEWKAHDGRTLKTIQDTVTSVEP